MRTRSVPSLEPMAHRPHRDRPPVVRFRLRRASLARLPVVRFRPLRAKHVGRLAVPLLAVPEGAVLAVREALVDPVGLAVLVAARLVPAGPAVRGPLQVLAARRVRTCRAAPAAVTTRVNRCRGLAFVPVAPAVLVAPAVAADPAVVVPVVPGAAVLGGVRPVRSVSRRASGGARLRSSLRPQ